MSMTWGRKSLIGAGDAWPARTGRVSLSMGRPTAITMSICGVAALLAVTLLGSQTSRAAEWKTYDAPDHSFSVDLPWAPKVQSRKGLIMMIAYPPSKQRSYIAAAKDIAPSQVSKPYKLFDAVLHALKTKSKARILSQKRHKVDGLPVDDVKLLSKDGYYMWERLMVADNRFYQLVNANPTESKQPVRFWNSFKRHH